MRQTKEAMVGQHQRRLYRTVHITGECKLMRLWTGDVGEHRLQHGLPARIFIVAKVLSQVSQVVPLVSDTVGWATGRASGV